MTTLAWDPTVLLTSQPDCQEVYTIKDPYILSIDEAFQAISEAVLRDNSHIDRKAASLVKALHDLLTSRLSSFTSRKLAANWHCLIYHATRLLIEKIALLEAQRESECTINTEEELRRACQFSEMGFFLHHFSPQHLDNLQRALQPVLTTLKRRVIEGHSSREQLSENQIPRPIVEELDFIFAQSGLLTSVHAGFGAAVSVSGFSLEISVPKADWWSRRCLNGYAKPTRTAYFHRDETCFVPKALLYLSEVCEDAGPFSICPSSFKQEQSPMVSAISRVWQYPYTLAGHELDSGQTCEFTQGLPLEFRVNSHYGFDIPDATDASETILKDENKFLGNPGTCIVFDGYNLLHRGGLCERIPRVALQIMLPAQVPSLGKWMSLLSGIEKV
jgi:hypothetical protein